ncbi:hypothetical protein Hsw_0146 [Hymenobacter swuensis DY53]|uniref:Uncharacterized protein n=1 Tax=Hymenobacter swuensis DY53 TaxID=1227739 RepID=W8EZG8_9BACT|nr:hypothetical protein Hsw_0146 [Hymenobacter swuensis DY53]
MSNALRFHQLSKAVGNQQKASVLLLQQQLSMCFSCCTKMRDYLLRV